MYVMYNFLEVCQMCNSFLLICQSSRCVTAMLTVGKSVDTYNFVAKFSFICANTLTLGTLINQR